ncbi:MAG: Gldg family protein, partial [Clostridia bacterium]|nr:Gldg family protein [Clostridia bacterium]
TFTDKGEKVTRWRHLEMEDVFEVSYDQNDQTSYTYAMYYGMMTLMSSKLETQVTSALASLTSEKVYKIAVLTHNGGEAPDALQTLMKQNNYEFTEVANINEEPIPEDADALIIARPMYDYTAAELKLVDDFLENDGQLGKVVLYVADAAQPDLPNLNEFLSEWGFSVTPGTMVYETDSNNMAYVGTYLFKLTEEKSNEFTGELADKDYVFYSTGDVAIKLKDPSGTKENESLLSFADTAAALPTDAESLDDKVADGPFVAFGLCRVTPATIDDLTNVSRSYVLVCSSSSFFPIGDYSAKVGNLYAVMNNFDTVLNKTSTGIRFDARTFTTDRLEEVPSTATVGVWTGVLAAIIVLVLVLTAVIIVTRRKARRNRK